MFDHWPDPRFRTLDAELLASISADDIGAAVVQHVEWRSAETPADRISLVHALPTGTRAVYVTWLVDVDVNNGGFNQFFFNPYGALAGTALAAYELLGAEEYAAVMRQAIATYETERERLAPYYAARTLEAFSESYRHTTLGEADQRYYALGDRIYHLWATFAHDHADLFVNRAE